MLRFGAVEETCNECLISFCVRQQFLAGPFFLSHPLATVGLLSFVGVSAEIIPSEVGHSHTVILRRSETSTRVTEPSQGAAALMPSCSKWQ